MTETLPKTITENGIQYILDEETQTYLPDWEISEQKEIGKYGLMRRDYLMNNRKSIYQSMLLNGTLNSHLAEIDETASRRLSEICEQSLWIIPEQFFPIFTLTATTERKYPYD